MVRGPDAAHRENDLRQRAADLLHEFVSGMTLYNVLVRPHLRFLEKYSVRAAWDALDETKVAEGITLGGLPPGVDLGKDLAKWFDLLVLRRQVADLDGDLVQAERMREAIQGIAENLLGKTAIPLVAEQAELLEAVAGEQQRVDVTLPMLEMVRLRLRDLAAFVTRDGGQNPVYTDFEDTITSVEDVDLRLVTSGLNWELFCEKATVYLREHEADVALQKLRRTAS